MAVSFDACTDFVLLLKLLYILMPEKSIRRREENRDWRYAVAEGPTAN
jgi:hypothetical protein